MRLAWRSRSLIAYKWFHFRHTNPFDLMSIYMTRKLCYANITRRFCAGLLMSSIPLAGSKLRVKSHYRGHKMALWLHLIPQLHRPGAAPRHHQFRSIHPDMFAGQYRRPLTNLTDTQVEM